MPRSKSPFELHFPENAIYQLYSDYISGKLDNTRIYYRARVEAVDNAGGQLESTPPNPPNSIRARIYTNGLDANLPSEALNIYHPFFPPNMAPPIDVGEHVFVMFEDGDMFGSGYWVSPIPQYTNVNYGNPDLNLVIPPSPADVFNGNVSQPETINPDTEYGGNTLQTERATAQRVVFNESDSIWVGKTVLHIGDSQVAGIYGQMVERKLREKGTRGTPITIGRVGWSVASWLSGRFSGQIDTVKQGKTLPELIRQHNPDIVLITLGGNGGQPSEISRLWEQAKAASKQFWVAPPVRFSGQNHHPTQIQRSRTADAIKSIVGEGFIESRDVTNNPAGRRPDGVHFLASAQDIVLPWVDRVVNR